MSGGIAEGLKDKYNEMGTICRTVLFVAPILPIPIVPYMHVEARHVLVYALLPVPHAYSCAGITSLVCEVRLHTYFVTRPDTQSSLRTVLLETPLLLPLLPPLTLRVRRRVLCLVLWFVFTCFVHVFRSTCFVHVFSSRTCRPTRTARSP